MPHQIGRQQLENCETIGASMRNKLKHRIGLILQRDPHVDSSAMALVVSTMHPLTP